MKKYYIYRSAGALSPVDAQTIGSIAIQVTLTSAQFYNDNLQLSNKGHNCDGHFKSLCGWNIKLETYPSIFREIPEFVHGDLVVLDKTSNPLFPCHYSQAGGWAIGKVYRVIKVNPLTGALGLESMKGVSQQENISPFTVSLAPIAMLESKPSISSSKLQEEAAKLFKEMEGKEASPIVSSNVKPLIAIDQYRKEAEQLFEEFAEKVTKDDAWNITDWEEEDECEDSDEEDDVEYDEEDVKEVYKALEKLGNPTLEVQIAAAIQAEAKLSSSQKIKEVQQRIKVKQSVTGRPHVVDFVETSSFEPEPRKFSKPENQIESSYTPRAPRELKTRAKRLL